MARAMPEKIPRNRKRTAWIRGLTTVRNITKVIKKAKMELGRSDERITDGVRE